MEWDGEVVIVEGIGVVGVEADKVVSDRLEFSGLRRVSGVDSIVEFIAMSLKITNIN